MSFAETAHLYEELKFLRESTSYLLTLSEKKLIPDECYRDMLTAYQVRKHEIDNKIEDYNKLNN